MKILSIVGARPQFVKAAVVSKRIRESGFLEILLHTGQHYDATMSDVFFQELDLPEPRYHLGIGSGLHGRQTADMLAGIEEVLLQERPDLVLVYGDTNTTLAGALAPVKLHIPVAHVEAGLRSHNRQMPEEINRIVADHCSDVLFCPTRAAVENLRNEGFCNILADGELIGEGSAAMDRPASPLVVNVGDVMLDIARQASDRLDTEPQRARDVLDRYGLPGGQYVLVTIHRAGTTDDAANLRSIVRALNEIASDDALKVFFPVHPRTRKALERYHLLATLSEDVTTSEPVSYMEMIVLESRARCILTDSGGVQKEAYFFGVPCVVAREETEWIELIDSGWNRLAGTATERILAAIDAVLDDNVETRPRVDFYGDGNAAGRITAVLRAWGA